MEKLPQKELVLFDFDGTLTRRDSLLGFLLFTTSKYQLFFGFIVLIFKFIGLLLSGKWSNGKAKEALFSVFFKGLATADLTRLGQAFFREKVPAMLRNDTLSLLRHYQQAGATVAVVSASADLWLKPFCNAESVDLLCTELEMLQGKFTGRFATLNCQGPEKARRIRERFQLGTYDKIIAFGNSSGDAEMFALADEVWMVQDDLQRLR